MWDSMKQSEAYEFPVREIWFSYSSVAEDVCLKACDSVLMGK